MAPSKASKRYRSPKCSALGCNSKFKKSHGYPTDPVLATAWALAALRPDILDALERPPFKLSHRLCSLHFEEDAYYDPPSLYKLKPYALPTLFENQQGELVRVKTDPEIEKLVSLKKAGIKVEADEFLKQVIRETEWSHSSTEEFRLLPSKRFKFDDPVVVKAEMPDTSLSSETLDEFKLPNNCSIRVKDVVIDYADMCKIETFEFVPAEPLHAIKADPDLVEVQHSSPDLKPVPEADSDDDVICVTDIDPLQTDECQAYEFSNSTTNTNTESTAEYAVQQSLHTTLDIKEETDDDIVWITNPLETDHQHSDTLKVEISESETELVQNNNAVQKMYPELADKEVQTPIELSVSTAQAKKMQVVLQQTLDVNKYLRERLTEAEEDLKICSKDVCEGVTLDEYANYTKTFFPDATMSKFVLDLLEVNQAAEVREKCQKHLVEPKVKNDTQKADVFNFNKHRNKVKSGRSSVSNKEINQAAPAKLKEDVTEVMEACHNHVTEPKVKNDAQKTRVFDFSKHQSRVKSGKSSPSNKDTKQPQPPIKQEDETEDAIQNKPQPNRLALPLKSKEFQNAAPCPPKLRNRVKASIQPGVSKTWMDLLKIKADTFDDFQRPCVLYMDEVRLKPNVYYNITSDKIVGVLPDAVTGQAIPARYATLTMVQGMCDEWHQPIAYHFSASKCGAARLKRMLSDAVETLTGFNLKVMALMCSADQNFIQMAQQLGVSVERPQFYLAAQRIHFLFDVQRLSRDLWNCFLSVNMRFNGSIISGRYLKVEGTLQPSGFPTKNGKLCKVSRNYSGRIFTEELHRSIRYTRDKRNHTHKFLWTLAAFSELMLEKRDAFLGQAEERDLIDACYLLLNRLQPVSRHSEASLCIKRWKVTVRSIANLWEHVSSLGFPLMFIPNMRCFQRFSQHPPKRFHDLQLTPNQFLKAFRHCFATELLDNKSSTSELYTKLLQAITLVQTNEQTTYRLNPEDIDYRLVEFGQFSVLCEYLLDKCLKQHTCPLCVNYVEVQKTQLRYYEGNSSIEALQKPHRTFSGFVTAMDEVFRLNFRNTIVHSCVAKALSGLLRKLSLVHPCLKFPFKYVTGLYARLRLYHTLRCLNYRMKCGGESFRIDDSVFMEQ